MQKVTIDKYRIVPAPQTGIGWVAVQEWETGTGEYKHCATFRSMGEAEAFINEINSIARTGKEAL